MATFGYTYVPL